MKKNGKKHGGARGRRANYVRYDISKVRYFHVSRLSIRYPTLLIVSTWYQVYNDERTVILWCIPHQQTPFSELAEWSRVYDRRPGFIIYTWYVQYAHSSKFSKIEQHTQADGSYYIYDVVYTGILLCEFLATATRIRTYCLYVLVLPYNTLDKAPHPLGRISKLVFSIAGRVKNAERRLYGNLRRDRSKHTIFVVCAPRGLEKIGSEICPIGGNEEISGNILGCIELVWAINQFVQAGPSRIYLVSS